MNTHLGNRKSRINSIKIERNCFQKRARTGLLLFLLAQGNSYNRKIQALYIIQFYIVQHFKYDLHDVPHTQSRQLLRNLQFN